MTKRSHTCIECVYLCQRASAPIHSYERNTAYNNIEPWKGMNYCTIVCYKKELFNKPRVGSKLDKEIYKLVTEPNNCSYWRPFEGISPAEYEQRESFKWAFRTFLISILTLLIILGTWYLSQFVLVN